MMRKFVPYQLSSLDGVADEPSQSFAEFDDVMRANLGWVIASPGEPACRRDTVPNGL